jgi:Uma2 family endonuclease
MVAPYRPPIVYPESDGKPMADNTLQWDWIVSIKLGIEDIFQDDPNVFVAGDLLWYPVEGEPGVCAAPDTMVAFGRPKGHRGSYKQWEEENIPPQVVFEILSESNTVHEMQDKLACYDEHGVEEYYQFDPQKIVLSGWIRKGEVFRRIWAIRDGWTSPRLRVHFKVEGDLILTKPNGERFPNPYQLNEQRAEAIRRAKAEKDRADRLAAEVERLKAMLADRSIDGS